MHDRYEGCMVATGAISGNIVLDEWQGQTSSQLLAYSASVLIVLAGLALLVQGENAVGAPPPPPSIERCDSPQLA